MRAAPGPHQVLQEWLLAHYGAEKFRPGLERVRAFLAAEIAAVQSLNPRIVTIAGTNGKGETAFTLGHFAREDRRSYVLWTSPHLLRITERFQSEAGEIGVDQLRSLVEEVREDALARGTGLSYYEVLWCAFVRWGLKRKAPLWILEVGLGGRLDAVNLLDAQLVLLPSISRDHQEFLGPTYRAILAEKLGVLRPGAHLISSLELVYLRELTHRALEDIGASGEDLFETNQLTRTTPFSERNRALAARASLWLGMERTQAPAGAFAGRGETWGLGPHRVQFYGSHNPDGMRKLVQLLSSGFYTQRQENFHQIWAAFSQRPPGDLRAMGRTLAEFASTRTKLFATQFTHPKASALSDWWGGLEGSGAQAIHEWTDLLRALRSETVPQRVLVTGSYYFVAAVQSRLLELGAERPGAEGPG